MEPLDTQGQQQAGRAWTERLSPVPPRLLALPLVPAMGTLSQHGLGLPPFSSPRPGPECCGQVRPPDILWAQALSFFGPQMALAIL